MNQNLKRILALLLCIATVLSIAACKPKTLDPSDPSSSGDPTTPGAPVGNKSKPENVWRETAIKIPDEITDAYNLRLVGDIAYFPTSVWDYEKYSGTQYITSYNMATGEMKNLAALESLESDYENQIYQNLSFSALCPLSDGSIWAVEEFYRDDYSDPNMPINERTTTLKRFSADGEVLAEIDASILFDSEYIWIYRMEADAQDNLYILFDSDVTVISSETNALHATIKSENGIYINSLVPLADGSIGAVVFSETSGGSKLRSIDLAAKAFAAASVDLAPEASYVDGAVRGDGDFEFYFLRYGAGVVGVKKDGSVVEVVNFLNSNINSDNINSIHRLPNDEFLMIWYDYEVYETAHPDGETATINALRFSRLSRVPADEIKEAIIINYACLWLDYDMKREILKFNKTNEDYRIVVDDYSRFRTDEDWSAGYTHLATDIILGKIPDIINIDNINIQPFVKKGMLADLYKLIDASPNHNREDYEQSVLEAAEINGGLYSFTPSFSVFTVAGKKSVVGDTQGWTIDDLNALMATLPAGTNSFDNMTLTKSDILNMSLTLGMSQYIDWDTATVSFGDNFIKLLEFANTFPKEINYDNLFRDDSSYQHWRDRYLENRAILEQSYIYGYRTIRELSEYTFGEDVTLIGFPSDDKLGSVFMPNYQFSISGKSSPEIQQICFEFLNSLVQTEPNFANSGGYFYSNFSIDKGYNAAVRAYELLPLRERPGYRPPDDFGNAIPRDDALSRTEVETPIAVMPMPEPGGGDDTQDSYERNFPLTQAEVDAVDELIANTKRFYFYDEGAMIIITEETDAYFAGQKSAAEATRLIQSRVQLYVSEQS